MKIVKTGVSALALIFVLGTASAQTGTSDAATTPTEGEGTGANGLQDIVVTASRRAENVQRSALSIQAISADTLARAGATRPEDLSKLATGVAVGTAGNYPQTRYRLSGHPRGMDAAQGQR